MPAAALRGALPAAARRSVALCLRHAAPPPARRPAGVRPQESKYEEDYLSTIGVDFVRGAPPLAPSLPAAALALSVACWLRATLRKSGPWRSTARRSSSSWCARPPRARTATARAAASAGPLASSAHGCRLLLRAAVGHCRAGALPDDHEQLLPREPGHHDRVRRDRLPVRALGAPCLAAAAPPLRGHSAGRSFDNVEYWLDEVDKYAGPHVQKVRAPNSNTRLCLCLWDSVPVPVSVLSVSVSVSLSLCLLAVVDRCAACGRDVGCSCSWGTRAT